ncbi:MAG TPA: aldo/keto reductase [Thermomicrobiales bacterium]|nr:aldo/keto reductase [Thermomicrobiales bacterium]
MEYGHVPGIAKPVSRLVQGTIMVREDDLPASFALLDAVFEQGCTAVDTARHYGRGNEATVGRWLKERRLHDRVFVIGKGAHHSPERNRVTPEDIAADLDVSLAQLGLETIDLYLLHRDDPAVPVGPIVEALNEHHRAGKIRAFGGSNWTTERIAEANAYARDRGLVPFTASSPQFSLAEQAEAPWPGCISISGPAGEAAREWYRREAMPLFCWSSLAGGFLSGRYDRASLASASDPVSERTRRTYGTDANFARLDRAAALAAERGLTIPQIALAYVLAQPLDLYALVGSESREEFAANVAASAVHLSPEDLEWLDLRREER